MASRRLKNKAFKPSGKPDLLSVIERRGRTGESYLADNGVTTIDQLQDLLENHLSEYDISEKFVALGETYVLALQLTSTSSLSSSSGDIKDPLPPQQQATPLTTEDNSPLEDGEEKPKKRKKNTDKSAE